MKIFAIRSINTRERIRKNLKATLELLLVLLLLYLFGRRRKDVDGSIFTGPHHFCYDISQRQDSGQFHPNPLILVMGLYKGGLASYSFKWNLKFMMSWKSHWDFYVVLPPNAELSQGTEKQLAWFVTITPEGYRLEGTDSGLVAGRSMVFPD